jgi:hypothetical protein
MTHRKPRISKVPIEKSLQSILACYENAVAVSVRQVT